MTGLKLKLLTDAVHIHMKREGIGPEDALSKYPALTKTEKAAVLAAFDGGK